METKGILSSVCESEVALVRVKSPSVLSSSSPVLPVRIRACELLGHQATVPKTGRILAYEVMSELMCGRAVEISLSEMYVDFDFVWGFYVTLYKSVPVDWVDRVLFCEYANRVFNARMSDDAKRDAHFYVFDRVKYDLYHDRIASYLVGEGYMDRAAFEVSVEESELGVFDDEEEEFNDGWSGY